MSKFIGMEDIIANALIERMEKVQCRHVSLETLMKYGALVIRYLQENGEEAVLMVSREYTDETIQNYSDLFEIRDVDGQESVVLKEDKTTDELRERFRAYLSLEVLKAFIAEMSIQVLGVENAAI